MVNISAEWRAALGSEWQQVQARWLHTLGNLTLTGYNAEYSDHPFAKKRDRRSDGHLFITVIAYQMVQTIRRRLGEQGESESWTSLRRILEGQHRVTATFQRKDGRTLHVRKATRAEPRQQEIYRALALDPAPGGTGGLRESPLRLNEGLGALDAWNGDTIQERAERLATKAAKVWAPPVLPTDVLEAIRDAWKA